MATTYALLVADTVVVPGEGELAQGKEKERSLTLSCPKQWTDVAYFFKVNHTQSNRGCEGRRSALHSE